MPSRRATAVRWTSALVEPPIACSTVSALRKAALVMISLGRGPCFIAISAASLPVASATRRRSEWVAGMVPLVGRPMPSVSTMQPMVLAVPITMQVPLVGASRSLTVSMSARREGAGAMLAPQAAAVGAGAQHLALEMADQHRPDRQHDRRTVDARRRHQLGRQGLVAAADQHDRVHRLGADHLLGVHRHQVAQEHAGRMREALVDRHRREDHRQGAGQHDAALHRLDQVGHVAVAGIVVAEGVGDADDRPVERVVGIAAGLDEGLAQEQRKARVAVGRQTLPHAGGLRLGHWPAACGMPCRFSP